jgi:hypothetical protein
MDSVSITQNCDSHIAANAAFGFQSAGRPRKRTRLILTARGYGLLTLLIVLLGLGLFLFFAYHAFGGFGVFAAASVIVMGAVFFTKFILLYPG